MSKIYSFFGGRRYFFSEQVFLTSLILLICGKIKAENFVDLTIWVLGIYAGANTIQKVGDVFKGKKEG